MKIRSVTSFYDPSLPQANAILQNLANFSKETIDKLSAIGFDVQTARLATAPFLYWFQDINQVIEMEQKALSSGFQYISIGPANPEHFTLYKIIPEILVATQNLFVTAMLTTENGTISLNAVRVCGEIIATAANITPDGFTNLRFAALANVSPHTPFLPAAYHSPGAGPACAIAIECADLVLKIFQNANSFADGRKELLNTLENESEQMQGVLLNTCERFGVDFKGFDFSPAPYPQDWCSLAGALEALGLPQIGMSGSLAAAAFLADTLDRGNWLHTGFNGLFMPVLEDSILALRTSQGITTMSDLLLYSSVCGTGLDTVPLPGDSTPEQLSALLLDVAALSARLKKPLTARLMPISGKLAGDPTEFDFEFFAKGKVMDLRAAPLYGLLSGDECLDIQPRYR